MLIKWSNRSPLPKIMTTIEPRMIIVFLAHSPTSFKHMSVWCPSLEPHQTTHHSNVSVWLRGVCSQIRHVYLNSQLMNKLLLSYLYWQLGHSNQLHCLKLGMETTYSKLVTNVLHETDCGCAPISVIREPGGAKVKEASCLKIWV